MCMMEISVLVCYDNGAISIRRHSNYILSFGSNSSTFNMMNSAGFLFAYVKFVGSKDPRTNRCKLNLRVCLYILVEYTPSGNE